MKCGVFLKYMDFIYTCQRNITTYRFHMIITKNNIWISYKYILWHNAKAYNCNFIIQQMEVRKNKKTISRNTPTTTFQRVNCSELFMKLARQCVCGFSYDLCRDFLDSFVFFFWASIVITNIVLHFYSI